VQIKSVQRAWIAIALVLVACSRPKPPTITPEKASVTAVGPSGIEMNVELGVDNPNAVDLSARSVTAKVVLDGKYPMSPVTVPHAFTLKAGARSHLAVPMALKWEEVSTLLALAGSNRDIPYELDGSVNVGGDNLNLDVPFHLRDVLTREQLVQTTLNSLPGLLR
jgi:LEA14-like dessication related protein